jgi:hypothetical protein
MTNNLSKSLILNEIKLHYDIKTDVDFAILLGISQPTLAAWRKRNTFDAELIITKCPDIDANWLLTGEGEMLKQKEDNKIHNTASEPQEHYGKKVPSQTSPKDLIIETQQKLIISLGKNVELLEEKLRLMETQLSTTIESVKHTQKVG